MLDARLLKRPRLVQVTATKLARSQADLDRFTDHALSLADQLRAQGYEVTFDNVDEWDGQ